MDQQQQPPQAPAPSVPPLYLIETALKVAFLVMSIFNLKYTLLVALAASVLGLLRVLKRPQFSK